ncbi:MAG: sulfatase [Pirellulaceae bacterium]|nr:sulfatase [Pirellulaceae bacterium]
MHRCQTIGSLCALVACAWLLLAEFAAAADPRPNVLFIAVDDLNDWIGCLGGNRQAQTPSIDALAARGVNFTRAYCASPVCNPSRTALMVGLRSSSTGVYNNNINRRDSKVAMSVVPLNSHFHASGYHVMGAGKIYHGDGDQFGEWDEYAKIQGGDIAPPKGASTGVGGIRFAPVDAKDEDMHDYHTVSYCIEQLQKKHDKPFFLACGLHKPHMAWNVPRKYYDQFPLEKIELPKVLETDLDDIPAAGLKMANPQGDHADMLASGRWKEAVQGYLAAGAFCDAMVGRLMKAFDESAYKNNTIIVFWGDHGWHLGEKQHWRKFALWEEATRAPLFFVAPGITKPNSTCERPVDFMSIYPSLCELAGLPIPPHNEGASVLPLLEDPAAAWEQPALTTHGKDNHAVRTERWRYIRYADGSEELYDHNADPLEWKNLAADLNFASVKADLAKWLPKVNVPDAPSKNEGADKSSQAAKKTKKKAPRE